MQDDPNHPWADAPSPKSAAYRAQKIVLRELVVDPPTEGDPLSVLVERLGLEPGIARTSVDALVRAGLAERENGMVRASRPARYFEFLWPVML